ncbi:MAG: hypothetical protein EP343_04145 [Deltaproteobacteria bacterium]|nr:MAG: hypothetical protein EP343_04145 [Deltaproteobacteria bacterium]
MNWKVLVLILGLLGLFSLSACIVRVPPPRNKRVTVRYVNGCRIKRVVFRCYYPAGHLVWRSVRCRDGRVKRTKRVVRRSYCRGYSNP